jgi:hypothetical protein
VEQELDLRARLGGLSAVAARRRRIAAGALGVLVLCSLLYVVIAADRPSLFAAPSHTGFFPAWMAGPLGGLWPGLTRNGTTLRWMFAGGLVVMYGCYLAALVCVPSLRLSARWAIATIVAMHLIFFLAPPMALTDIFNYINYGRMEVVHHLNPYTTYPILEPHSDPSYALSNWHELLSPYGPLFTMFTFALVPLGVAGSFWAIKVVLMVTSLALIALVWKCARLLSRDPVRAIMFVGLNPIVIVWGLGGDHNDFLTVFAIVLGFYLLLRARATHALVGGGQGQVGEEQGQVGDEQGSETALALDSWRGPLRTLPGRLGAWLWPLSAAEIGAGVAFVAATALKASAGILIPIVLAALLRSPRRATQLALGLLAATVVIGIASLIAFGLHIPDLSTQSRLVTSISIPNLIGLAIGTGGETEGLHYVLTAALVLVVLASCVVAWRRHDALTASGWSTVTLLVTLGWVLPWYILWLLPLAALSSSRRLRTAALVLGAYLIVAWSPASGLIWSAIGFHPEKTPLGQLHQRYVKELLN